MTREEKPPVTIYLPPKGVAYELVEGAEVAGIAVYDQETANKGLLKLLQILKDSVCYDSWSSKVDIAKLFTLNNSLDQYIKTYEHVIFLSDDNE